MPRHGRLKRIQFKIQIRMTCREHLVVYIFIFRSQMAFQASFGSLDNVPRVVHSQLQRLLMRPSDRGMRPKPRRRRPVATFAAHAIADIKRSSALRCGSINRVARQAFRCGVCRSQSEDFRHARRHGPAQHRVGARVLVLCHPCAVFVLPNARLRHWPDAAVARRRAAAARTHVLNRRCGLRGRFISAVLSPGRDQARD